MLTEHSACIVIPVYKEYKFLSKDEILSLDQCCKILAKHRLVIVCPNSLDVEEYVQNFNINIERFIDKYFLNIRGYNQMMLNVEFYQRFLSFEYMLIYQLDAMVFRDDLEEWCSKNYDYIGAPWLTNKLSGGGLISYYKKRKAKVSYLKNKKYKNVNIPLKEQFYNKVGNGGFSLRRTQKMLDVLHALPQEVQYYLENSNHSFYNEDAFWSLEANRDKERLRIPSYTEAVYFSIEFMPELAFKMTDNKLPFGCHDWDSHLEFWHEKFLAAEIQLGSFSEDI